MKKFLATASAIFAGLMFSACDDSSSSASDGDGSSSSSASDDCTLSEDGVKVLLPSGGETFTIGDSISVTFVAKYKNAGGFRVLFFADSSATGEDFFENSIGEEAPDGSSCTTVDALLSTTVAVASDKAFIRVQAYGAGKIRGDSQPFTVQE